MRLRLLLLALAISNAAAGTTADDKDSLRDACIALKDKVKRSQCFDAIERMTQSQPPAPIEQKAALEPKKEKPIFINVRALSCEIFEFSELNSLSEDEALGLYCGYEQAHSSASARSEEASIEHDPGRKVVLLRSITSTLRKCQDGIVKTMDLMSRKFPTNKLDCTKVAGYSSPKKPAPDPASETRTVVFDGVSWVWPVNGTVITPFDGKNTKFAMEFGGKPTDSIVAVADGQVIAPNPNDTSATTDRVRNMIVIKHSNGYTSIYMDNKTPLVKKGDMVTTGQKIAEMGYSETGGVKLTFRILGKDSKAIDPMTVLDAGKH